VTPFRPDRREAGDPSATSKPLMPEHALGTGHGHDHGHSHSHTHGHRHLDDASGSAQQRRLRIALVLTATFLVAEVVGGILSNSLALLADAGHMLTDVAALALSLFVAWFSRQPASPEKTYGYLRWEILAAFLNGAVLLLVSGGILWEGVARLREPEAIASGTMLAVALGGLVVNVICAWVLHPVHQHSLNARGAYLHVLGDLLGSVGTVAAAVVVGTTGWLAADPIASILVTLLIVRSAWRLLRESIDVLLESTPSHISVGSVRQRLQEIAGVESVHDLHVWTVTSGVVAMSAHAIVPEPSEHQRVLGDVLSTMQTFGIEHVTVQIERQEMCPRLHP
jgi:cobalt-zinc-cadmium efflux system protein